MSINFAVLNKNEMTDVIYQNKSLPVVKLSEERQFGVIDKFHYFNCHDLTNIYCPDKLTYIVAYNNQLIASEIIGVLSVATYYCDDEKMLPYIGINFIDVRSDYKRQGISKQLIQELDKISQNDIIISSRLSDEGKLCRMNDHFKAVLGERFFIKSEDYYKYLHAS